MIKKALNHQRWGVQRRDTIKRVKTVPQRESAVEILNFDLLCDLGNEWMPMWLVHLEDELVSYEAVFFSPFSISVHRGHAGLPHSGPASGGVAKLRSGGGLMDG